MSTILRAGVLTLALAAGASGAEPATNGKPLADAIKEVLNRGAALYNNGDRNGAYHLFEGALLALKPQLAGQAELVQIVDTGLRDVEQRQSVGERAWALRTALIDVRNKLAIDGAKAATEAAPKPEQRPNLNQPGLPPLEPASPPEKKPEPKPAAKAPAAANDALTGKVTLDGKPLAGVFIRLTSEEGPGKGYTAKTDADAAFEIKDVKPGKYRVSFTSTDPAVAIPEQYRNSSTTPLLFEVSKEGAQKFNVDLKSQEDKK